MRQLIAALLLCSANGLTLRQQESLAMSMPLSGLGCGERATPAFNRLGGGAGLQASAHTTLEGDCTGRLRAGGRLRQRWDCTMAAAAHSLEGLGKGWTPVEAPPLLLTLRHTNDAEKESLA